MEYFAPGRPRGLSGRLCYTDPQGKLIAALPDLGLSPTEQFDEGNRIWSVTVWLLMGTVTARPFTAPIFESGVPLIMRAWVDNPEAVLRDYFGYQGYSRPQVIAPSKLTVNLEDLGL